MTDHPLRAFVRGHVAVPARLEPWQANLLGDPAAVQRLTTTHGSPVNLLWPAVLRRHAQELVAAAAGHGLELRIFYARKANKALSIVDAALAGGHGIDVASRAELAQVLERGAAADRVIVTAAVKPTALIRLAIESDVVISVDNLDELASVHAVAESMSSRPRIALRLMPELPGLAPSRFGLTRAEVNTILAGSADRIRLIGLHFHLGGYAAIERAAMLRVALDTVDLARAAGHDPQFIDIGGGVPMSYLDDPEPWSRFRASAKRGEEPLWKDADLGTVYPMWQTPVRGEWLDEVLSADGIADGLLERALRVHLEPGRALLDGAGMTLASVVFRKRNSEGTWLVGLAMNRTQVRSAADDFILDPILVPAPDREPTEAIDAYLVGAYCIEDELITRRRLHFPHGVAVGDTIAFINTAGYLMHILESTSHQMPLARNLHDDGSGRWLLDPIDERPQSQHEDSSD